MENFYLFFGCFLVFLLQIPASAQQKKKQLFFLKSVIDYNREYGSNYSLIIKNQNTSLDLEVLVTKTVENPVWNRILIEMKPPKKNAYSQIMSFDVNFCDLLERTKAPGFNLLNVWFNNVLKYGELPTECPIKKGHYYWRDFKVNQKSTPPFILKGFYRINVMV